MVGGPDLLEAALRFDVLRGEQIGHGRQGARGRLGVADPEIEALVALQHVFQGQAAGRRGDQHRAIAVLAGGVEGAGEDLGVGPAHSLQTRQVGEPAHIGLAKAQGLDQRSVVGAVEGLHRNADLLLHVSQDRPPEGVQAGGVFRRQDREVQHLGRGAFRRFALGTGGEAQGQGDREAGADQAAADHWGAPSQKTSSNSGP